jgi:uncharacterized protein (DUF3820 family)
MILLPFGKYKGTPVELAPSSYLMWLSDADEWEQEKGHPWGKAFKVASDIQLAARTELERRGYVKKGLRWVKE